LILGSIERRSGGHGCVQFVHDPNARRDFAVKFLLQRDTFRREALLYNDPSLRAMMAATKHIHDNADGALRSPGGYVFPPHIMIERGEPLDEWIKRMARRASGGTLPLIPTFQALINIAERLLMLHEAGYVHCDLKPSNVLWLSDMHAWTLIDFGSAGKAGAIDFSLLPLFVLWIGKRLTHEGSKLVSSKIILFGALSVNLLVLNLPHTTELWRARNQSFMSVSGRLELDQAFVMLHRQSGSDVFHTSIRLARSHCYL
jgi:serine/threonine protein kinase